jgi:hypothetical protein
MSNIKNLNPIKSKKSKPADFVKTTIKYPAFNKQKLETFINTQLTANITSKPKTYDVLTHEVVFLEPIPLKYIDKIIVAPSMVKRVTEFILKIKEKGIINSDLQLQILRRPDATQWKSALFKE